MLTILVLVWDFSGNHILQIIADYVSDYLIRSPGNENLAGK